MAATDPSPSECFARRRYLAVPALVDGATARLAARYARLRAAGEDEPEGDTQVPATHCGYADPLMEALLEELRPRIEALTGLELWPTYSYYRLYKRGDALAPHTDRGSCEVSVSLCLGADESAGGWPLWLSAPGERGAAAGPSPGRALSMRPGDAVVYRGCDLLHWREPLAGRWQAQVFLHYVDRHGPLAVCRLDGRPALGLPPATAPAARRREMRRAEKRLARRRPRRNGDAERPIR